VRALVVAVAALAAAVLSACGGEDEKDVRNAVGRFASATETEDARSACRAVTPDTRRLLGRLAAARLGRPGCEALLRARFAEAGGRSFAIDAATLAAVEEARVEIDGDTAEIDTFGDRQHLPLERSGGEWRLDLIGIPAQGYSIGASVMCTEQAAARLVAPLPEPTRKGYAFEARLLAQQAEELADDLREEEPPRGLEGPHRALIRGLRSQVTEMRRIARDVARGGPVLEAVSRRGPALRAADRTILAAHRALDVACDPSIARHGAPRYRQAAERVCRGVSRRIQRLGEPSTAAGLAPYMQRVRAAGATATRGLRRLDPPRGLGDLHRRTVAAYDTALDAIPAIARATDPDAAYDRYGLRSLRASVGFSRLGLPTCASL
jgi:hypothetical protein